MGTNTSGRSAPARPNIVASARPLLVLLCVVGGGCGSSPSPAPDPADRPLDLSGLAWLGGDTFLAVHDSKVPGRPRASLLRLPGGDDGPKSGRLRRETADDVWPAGVVAMDLESAARVPGTPLVLLAESGQAVSGEDAGQFRRLFLVEHGGGRLRLWDTAAWPVPVRNVEGTAVARVGGDRLVFLFAEREQGKPDTKLRWADLRVEPSLGFGEFREVTLPNPAAVGPQSRPVSALDVADDGTVYVASAVDPDVDDGPYTSAVWRVGRVVAGTQGEPAVVLDAEPLRVGTVDGFKVEAVAVRTRPDGTHQVFVGTDDEHFGGALRPLPPSP